MKFTTKPVTSKVSPLDTIELIEAQENMHQAWLDLDESVKKLDEVQAVMDNIDLAVRSIEQFGSDAVPVLNIDKGLENLLGVEAKLITADKALEGLGEAAKAAWEKLKEWVKILIAKIKTFFSARAAKHKMSIHQLDVVDKEMNAKKASGDIAVDKEIKARDLNAIMPYVIKASATVKGFEKLIEHHLGLVTAKTATVEDIARAESVFVGALVDKKWFGFADDIGVEVCLGFDVPTKHGSRGLRGTVGTVPTADCWSVKTGTNKSLGYMTFSAKQAARLFEPMYAAFDASSGGITAKFVKTLEDLDKRLTDALEKIKWVSGVYGYEPDDSNTNTIEDTSTNLIDASRARASIRIVRGMAMIANSLLSTIESLDHLVAVCFRTSLEINTRKQAEPIYLR